VARKQKNMKKLFYILLFILFVASGYELYAVSYEARISFTQALRKAGFTTIATQGNRLIASSIQQHTIICEDDSRRVFYDGVAIWLNAPVMKRWNGWTIQQGDFERTLQPLVFPTRELTDMKTYCVVLDPGHGGEDKGASDLKRGIEEKDITLDIARCTRALLQTRGINVYLTRNKDATTPLEQRVNFAKKMGATIFVSIHLNAAENSSSCGIETYALTPVGASSTANEGSAKDNTFFSGNSYDKKSIILGYKLQRNLLKNTKAEDRGLRRARFVVLRDTPCPAVLVELGFISHRTDRARLIKEEYRQALAQGIAQGILDYIYLTTSASKQPQK
jgi:N-acetylmuramoyl-L-alanine amidase